MFIHHFLKIHYLSGAILIQTTGVADSLYYSYSDSQGSLIALVHEGGSVIQRFAYDPWGARRDPNNWTVKDSRTSFIINRGYTGHEHLDAFGIINMNGRVYDPLTAQFFSPDPYVQAPGEWLNYNRYTYCSGNPFRYTDPSGNLQIGPFYISLNIGWSANGGLSFGISAGVGLENLASVGISIGLGAKYGNFSISINGSLGGAYAYAGYDTKGGWMAGAGISYISAFSMWSPVSINTNMFGVGVDYSENGGLSGNFLGASISGSGVSFNPSIGASYTAQWGLIISENDVNIGVVQKDKAKIKTNEEFLAYCKEHNIDPQNYNANSVDIENNLPKELKQNGYIRQNGIIYKKVNDVWVEVGGVTESYLNGFKKPTSSIFMSTHDTYEHFQISLNHEFIHSWQWANYGYKMSGNDWESYKEYAAYSYTKMYYPNISVPSYYGPLSLPLPSLPYVPTLY